jgi:ubiquinone/menaquinone biosynthesis C-methylase UbiE
MLAHAEGPRRLNWGCGDWVQEGWVNSDIKDGDGIVTADVREGLPFEDEYFDYVVSIHALPELGFTELVPALEELRRVLKTGGVLRLGLPDLEKAFDAYRRGDRDFFLVPDEMKKTLGGKFITQVLWYGYSRTIFVPDFIGELLHDAGFAEIHQLSFGTTASNFPEIVSLDNRKRESLFVEAVKA